MEMIMKGKRTKRPRQPSPLTLSIASTSSTITEYTTTTEEEEDLANCLILLAQSRVPLASVCHTLYQCTTCDRHFSSFQALGGHRASHKKPRNAITSNGEEKKPFSVTIVEDDMGDTDLSLRISSDRGIVKTSRKPKVHECSICGAEFSSGQALGGHMRRHRQIIATNKNVLSLDLNLPAPEDDCKESRFGFGSNEQVIVFSASSMVDCHY